MKTPGSSQIWNEKGVKSMVGGDSTDIEKYDVRHLVRHERCFDLFTVRWETEKCKRSEFNRIWLPRIDLDFYFIVTYYLQVTFIQKLIDSNLSLIFVITFKR